MFQDTFLILDKNQAWKGGKDILNNKIISHTFILIKRKKTTNNKDPTDCQKIKPTKLSYELSKKGIIAHSVISMLSQKIHQ